MLEPGFEPDLCSFKGNPVFVTLNCHCKTDEQGVLLE